MPPRGQGFHKPKSANERKRRTALANFIKERRWALDITQKCLAKRVNLSQPEIARIEAGENRPVDLETYADGLELKGPDRLAFFRLAGYIVEESSSSTDDCLLKHVVDLANHMHKMVYQVRIAGNPQLAITQSIKSSESITMILSKSPSPVLAQSLQRTQGLLLYEQVVAYNEIYSPQENFEQTANQIDEIYKLAKRCDDKELYGLAHCLRGNNYYLIGHYEPAMRFVSNAYECIQNADDKLWILRELALCSAYLNEEQEFTRIEQEARNLIAEGKLSRLERVCEMYEALGRGWGLLRKDKAFRTLEEGWAIYAKLEQAGMGTSTRLAQLVRGELTAAQHLGATDKTYLERLGNRGIDYAQRYGYQRYAEQIKTLQKTLIG